MAKRRSVGTSRKKSTVNLNRLVLNGDSGTPADGQCLEDHGGIFGLEENEHIEVMFRDLEHRLVGAIKSADYVFGSVAWLTSPEILRALSKKRGVSIIVQKEDFLRPDHYSMRDIRSWYSRLPGVYRHCFSGIAGELSVCGNSTVEPVRCLGNFNADKDPAFPRAHNKFGIFCKRTCSAADDDAPAWQPYAVWTGSFNWSITAGRSLENAVLITAKSVAEAYLSEFEQLLGLSEPLNWSSRWTSPEWRIGT